MSKEWSREKKALPPLKKSNRKIWPNYLTPASFQTPLSDWRHWCKRTMATLNYNHHSIVSFFYFDSVFSLLLMNAFKNLRELIGPFISYQNTDESPEPAPLTPLLLEECECIFGLSSETTTDGSLQCILDRLLSLKPYTQWFTVSSLDLRSQKLTSVCDLAAILPSLETLDL